MKHKIVQVPGSSTHAVVDEDGNVVAHYPNEEEARQFAGEAEAEHIGPTPAIPTEEPKPKAKHAKHIPHAPKPKKKHKQSK
jgi:hypothetical protein